MPLGVAGPRPPSPGCSHPGSPPRLRGADVVPPAGPSRSRPARPRPASPPRGSSEQAAGPRPGPLRSLRGVPGRGEGEGELGGGLELPSGPPRSGRAPLPSPGPSPSRRVPLGARLRAAGPKGGRSPSACPRGGAGAYPALLCKLPRLQRAWGLCSGCPSEGATRWGCFPGRSPVPG